MEENRIDVCIHCGKAGQELVEIPVDSEFSIKMACKKCFYALPIHTVASPKLPDYMRWATDYMRTYRTVVEFMRGKNPVMTKEMMDFLGTSVSIVA